jgi:transcriptional regulator with XRE-family HTH domain
MMSIVYLSKRLADLRMSYGWTLRDLAGRIEAKDNQRMSYSYLSALEKGKSMPSIGTLDRIAVAYGLTICELLQCGKDDA